MKKTYSILMLCFLLVLFCNVAYSKNEPPQPKPDAPPNPGLPVDGGLEVLFISGIAFGVYHLRKKE